MKTKTYFILLSLLFLFLLASCEDVEIEKLPNIDYNSITKEVNFTLSTDVKADITTLLDSNRAIKIPKEYYKVKEYDIDQSNTSIDNPITIGNYDSLLKYINSTNNEEILTIYMKNILHLTLWQFFHLNIIMVNLIKLILSKYMKSMVQ